MRDSVRFRELGAIQVFWGKNALDATRFAKGIVETITVPNVHRRLDIAKCAMSNIERASPI
jgi:hypothetical protein